MATTWSTAHRQALRQAVEASGSVELRTVFRDDPQLNAALQRWMGSKSLHVHSARLESDGVTLAISGELSDLSALAGRWNVVLENADAGRRLLLTSRETLSGAALRAAAGELLEVPISFPDRLGSLLVRAIGLTLNVDTRSAECELLLGAPIGIVDGVLVIAHPGVRLVDSDLSGQALSIHVTGELSIGARTVAIQGASKVANIDQMTFAAALNSSLSLAELTAAFQLPSVPLPGVAVSAFQLVPDFGSQSFKAAAAIGSAWQLTLGHTELQVSDLTLVINYSSGHVAAELLGNLSFPGGTAALQAPLADRFVFTGEIGPLNVADFIGNILDTQPPAILANIRLPKGRASFPANTTEAIVQWETELADLGTLTLLAGRIAGDTHAIVALLFTGDWKPSSLSAGLQPLDIFTLRNPALSYSTLSYDALPLPAPKALSAPRIKGGAISGDLDLRHPTLQLVRLLLNKNSLPATLAIADNISASTLVAALANDVNVLPGVLTLRQVNILVRPTPFQASFSSAAELSLFGHRLPELTVRVSLDGTSQSISLSTSEPWVSPLGLPKLTVESLAVDYAISPVPAYGFSGRVLLANRPIRLAAQLTAGSVPSLLIGEFTEPLSLQAIISDLVGINLPADLVELRDAKIYLVGNPNGVTIGAERFPAGASLEGTVEVLEFSAKGMFSCDPDRGVKGKASFSKVLEIGSAFRLSDESGNGPPSLSIDSTREPFVEVDGSVSVFELRSSIKLHVVKEGLAFKLSQKAGIVSASIDCLAASTPSLALKGSVDFPLVRSVGPIRLLPGGPDLGTIDLNTGFRGALEGVVEQNSAWLSLGGQFEFASQVIEVPALRINNAPASLAELAQKLVEWIAANTANLLRELFATAEKWLAAIADGVIRNVVNVALALRNHFGKSAEFIANAIANTLKKGLEEATRQLKEIGESAERIAEALKGLGNVPRDIRKALENAGFPPAIVSAAMAIAFPSIPHGDAMIIPHGDFAAIPHADVKVVPHGDAQARPHVDVLAVPHADMLAIPHADMNAIPHGDFRAIPHGDANALPHGDAALRPHGDVGAKLHIDSTVLHVDFGGGIFPHGDVGGAHGDAAGAPHIDFAGGPHVDVAPTGHIDTAATGHIDTPPSVHADSAARAHVDAAAKAHLDVAASLHVDSPATAHVDAPSTAHVDTPPIAHVDAP